MRGTIFSFPCKFVGEFIRKDKENFRLARKIPPSGKLDYVLIYIKLHRDRK